MTARRRDRLGARSPSPATERESAAGPDRSSLGFLFFVTTTMVCLGIIALGYVTLARIGAAERALDEFAEDIGGARLLPEAGLEPLSGADTIQVFYTTDGQTLTPYNLRPRRVMTPAQKDRLALRQLLKAEAIAGLESTIPEGTELRGFFRLQRTAYVDLSRDFVEAELRTPLREKLAVYSIVNSLALADPEIDGVQIMIEGKTVETAWGWLDCSTPLGANLSIIRR